MPATSRCWDQIFTGADARLRSIAAAVLLLFYAQPVSRIVLFTTTD